MKSNIAVSGIHERDRQRRAWIIYGILISIGVLANFSQFVTSGDFIPLVVTLVGCALILLLLRFEKLEWAGALFVGFLTGRSLMIGLQSTNVLIPMGVIIATVGAVLIQSTFRRSNFRRGYIGLAVITIGLILLDLFWPAARMTANAATSVFLGATTLAAVALLIYFLIRDFASYSLRYKFIFSVSLFAILSLGATTYFVSRNTSEILLEEAGGEFLSAAAFNASVIGETIQRDSELLATLGSEPLIIDLARSNAAVGQSPTALESLQAIWANPANNEDRVWVAQKETELTTHPAADVLARYEAVILRGSHDVILVDQYGQVLAAPTIPDDIFVGETDWFQQVSAAGYPSYVSNVMANEQDGHLEMVFAAPIIDPETGQFMGAVAAINNLDTIRGLFETTNSLGTNAIMGVIVGENREMTIEDGALTFKDITLAEPLRERLQANGFGLGDFFGEPNLISYVEVESPRDAQAMALLDWAVIIHQEESIALAAVTTQQRTQLLIGLLVVSVGIIAAIVVAQIVASPLLALQEAAGRMAEGDYTVRAPVQSGDEIASVAVAFNNMAAEIQDSVQNLEARIAERTQTINTSYRISRSLATLIRKGDLIKTVVDEFTANFEYDLVQIYMLNQTSQMLELFESSGENGQQLMDQKLSVTLGQGLIGRAAESQAAILVSDVKLDPRYIANPLLPDTRSELVVPIVVGQRTLGVIDIQENEIGRINDRDIELVESIAGQLAISLRNAEFYEEAESQARREATINHIRQRILQTQNVNDALKIAARELAQVTDGKVVVRLEPEKRTPPNGRKHSG